MQTKTLRLKRALREVLIFLLLGTAGVTMAQSFTMGDLKYSVNSDGVSVTVIGHVDGQAASGTLSIPDHVTYNETDYAVTVIGNSAFYHCLGLTGGLIIPNSVNSIGDHAFEDCTGLTSIEISNSVISIGELTFFGCESLTSIEIPNSVIYIGFEAFSWCFGIEQIVVDVNNTVYDSRNNCNAIINSTTNELVTGCKNTEIPDSVTSIGDSAFEGCRGLASIEIPNSVTSIGYYAFLGCVGLTSIEIPNSLTSIGIWDEAFWGCGSLTSITALANNPPVLGTDVFFDVDKSIPVYVPAGTISVYQAAEGWNEFTNIQELCNNPAPINFADANVKALCVANWDTNGDGELSYAEAATVTDLGEVFRENSNITAFDELQYFTGLSSIREFAFSYCTNLISIKIPKSVSLIGNWAFIHCSVMTSIDIPNSVTIIGDYGFSDCNGLALIGIPNSVTSIGYRAFDHCNGVEQIIVDMNNTVYDSRDNCNAIIKTNDNELITGCKNTEIPNSVTSIGDFAFESCTGLTSIEIPNSVTYIGGGAFADCVGLTSIEIPNSVWGLGGLAFGFCTGLISVIIPNSVTFIGTGQPFSGCSALEQIIVESGNPVYDSRENCNAIIRTNTNELIVGCQNTVIPNSVTSIGTYAFKYCRSLTSIVIPNSVTSIGNGAFYYCSSLTSIEIPDSVTSIGNQAFCACSSLTLIEIPNSVTSIGSEAFSLCEGLTSIEIPNSVTTIGSSAFYGCSSLTSIEIPNSVTSIGNWAFSECNGLTSITVFANNPPVLGADVFFNVDKSIPVYVPAGTISAYQAADRWSEFTNIQELGNNPAPIIFADANVKALCVANWDTNGDGELSYAEAAAVTDLGDVFTNNSTITSFDELQYFTGLTAIGDEAFFGCCDLTSMEIPSSVTVIGNRAFYGCDGLTSIEIPNSVASIGDEAFSSCSWVVQIVVDVNNTVYDSRNNCNAIIKTSNNELIAGCQNTEIPNSVTSIGNNAFDGCFYMTSIEIPNSVTSIGNVAFNGCSGLTSIEIPNSVTFIGHWAFGYCTGLTLIEIPHSVTSIGNSAFSDCSGLEQIVVDVNNTVYDSRNNCNAIINKNTNELVNGCKNTEIPNSVTSIGSYAFSSCYGLTSMEIPNSVTSIECGAFYDCWGLTSIEIPNSVTSIGEQAFYGCDGLTSIEIPNSVTSIGNDAFNGCRGLTSIEIPNSVTSIGNDAFNGCRGLTSIEIPNSVTSIGSLAFGSCNSLTTIRVDAVTPPSLNWGVFNGSTCPIYVPYESINAYKTSWTDYASRIQPWMQKSVPGYGTGNDKWVFIASPLAENTAPSSTAIEGLMATTATDYDLFRFNQESNGAEWQNYKAHTADFMLENGKGYLYANKEDVNVVFMGTFNEETSQDVELDYIAGKPFAGWNLVGNPFPYAATVDRSYYVMNAEGTGLNPTAASSGTSIEACTGIMVKAETTGESVTFTKPSRKMTENNGLLHIIVANEDKAIVSFNEGDELGKYYFGEQNANIYIPKNGKEYAIAVSDNQGEMPLNFKAAKNGTYTLTVEMENVALDYLHLIDNMTGVDIDLLQTPEYTFTAKTTDYESRFRLLFDANDNGASTGSATFAYYADGEIRLVVETQDFASLQIVDVMGRVCREMLASPNHRISTAGMTPGMYVLRLIEDDNVKTQKIVVQ